MLYILLVFSPQNNWMFLKLICAVLIKKDIFCSGLSVYLTKYLVFYMHEIINRQSFNQWLSSPLGRYLTNLQVEWLQTCIENNGIGQELVVLGGLNAINHQLLNLPALQKSHITIVGNNWDKSCSLLSNYVALPLLNESVDLIILPHIVDSYLLPLDILREVYRVLKPEGKLYLTCFNKLSLWGLYRVLAKLFIKTPWRCGFTTFLQLEDWLGELGFDIISSKSAGYCLPLNIEKLIALQAIINKLSPIVALPFGAINLLEVRKRVIPLTLQAPLIHSKLVKQFGVNG
jgi:SAM-dependent methyltransferase